MPHLVLLGDSVFDNGAYTSGGPAVIEQVSSALPPGWAASLCAVDGSTTEDIEAQLAQLPETATHLVLSVGGNNALLRADVLQTPVASSGEALLLLGQAAADFEASYRRMLAACLTHGLPLVVCTVYHGNFPEPSYQACVAVALCAFNDAIIRVASEHGLKVIDLRRICTQPVDYANPIEPSSAGGSKIASAIAKAVTEQTPTLRGACVVAG
ncbi:SGNH/GDSL hydrolase family protein [Ideonella sp. DXS29W]|uniref:SGNH/GDSL hydrolase family protein n=1 Tax=Ideonella lacteola TaxID=2984193 RepID=A0ABU9BID0_9BURK